MPTQLFELDAKHETAFLEMVRDYEKNDPQTFNELYKRAAPWSSSEFKVFLKEATTQRLDWRPKAKQTSVSRYVLVGSEGQICGNGILQFPLNEKTEKNGGNLRFDVPPSQRGHGCGALVLNGMLFEAVRAGLARALVTCPIDNAPALRAITDNRGELDDTLPATKTTPSIARYWIRFR